MSNKNSEGKRTARERMHEERQLQEKRSKRNRLLAVLGGILAVLLVAALVAWLVQRSTGNEDKPVPAPKGAIGKNKSGTKVVLPVGDPRAPVTMTVYEDFRCPACGAFEAKQHKAVDALVAAKTLRVDYHVVSFIDNGGGSGSKKSANAAACAMDTAGPAKFADYHEVLYQNQPQESDDAFGKDSTLLKLAGQVDGLRSKSFNSCVAKDSWGDWVGAVQKDFDGSGYSSTPTVLIDGKPLTDPVGITPAQFTKQVKDAAAQK